MATKADFNPEEWRQLVEGPTIAGMIVLTSAGGGTFRETFALARAWADARTQHGASQLLDELAAEKPGFDRHRYGSTQELHEGRAKFRRILTPTDLLALVLAASFAVSAARRLFD